MKIDPPVDAQKLLSEFFKRLEGDQASQILTSLEACMHGENVSLINIVPVPGKATWESRGPLTIVTLPGSEGLTGPELIARLDDQGKRLSDEAQLIMRSENFKPTHPGFVHKVVLLKANYWMENDKRTIQVVQAEGVLRKWSELHMEVMPMIRGCFSDRQLEKMGLRWIMGMHKPIVVKNRPRLLLVSRGLFGRYLGVHSAYPDSSCLSSGAFAWSIP